ncbi:MAG TPA: tyrosine--tRNA ligase [Candidatus Absconditabacterales bacterium]|nr:tyrosine--tRNA ligase [Candidatus Absconditabacterales bacterium]HNG97208.1 tyrosine--tRNA ligase [Candidatus Absconditabacterales bacterium]
MLPLRQELQERGLLKQYSNEALFDLYDRGGQTCYLGVDPSADSLTIGNFAMFMTALQFMKRGNKLILIVGGETGMIGDPGGKDSERTLVPMEIFEQNFQKIDHQVGTLLHTINKLSGYDCQYMIKNNHDFYEHMTFSEFLRSVGKHITVNSMMNKETVAKRINDPDKSISYTEFSYMLIQGYDFVKLYQDYGCKLQICGSDQRGNGVTGIELIGKMLGQDDAYVMTSPLILDSSGKKFGKSEGNAIWLDPTKNSPYKVYQYFMNVTDDDVGRFLRIYSLLDLSQIQDIQNRHNQAPERRMGQKELAYRVCQIIFGTVMADQAQTISDFMFSAHKLDTLKGADRDLIIQLAQEVGSLDLGTQEVSIIDALVQSGLCESRSDAKKNLEQGAIMVDETPIKDMNFIITSSHLLLQKGKKNMKIIRSY